MEPRENNHAELQLNDSETLDLVNERNLQTRICKNETIQNYSGDNYYVQDIPPKARAKDSPMDKLFLVRVSAAEFFNE
ncbi:hypothetical protein AB3N59_06950 [Leptospira sp. WS92.C1]